MTVRLNQQHHGAAQSVGKNEAPPWVQWTGYAMCGWSLLFAVLHFAAGITWTPLIHEGQRIEANWFAWLLCAGLLCVIGVVTALALRQARQHSFPHWFMQAILVRYSCALYAPSLYRYTRQLWSIGLW